MSTLPVYNINGEKKEEMEINQKILDVKISKGLIYYAVLRQLANKRRGTAYTKTKGEVRGGGRKPWKQKGTGRARQGSIRAPQWKGGGVVFGPRPRSYKYNLPKKAKKKALFMAIADKIKNNNLILLNEFNLTDGKTKNFVKILDAFKILSEKVLIVYSNGMGDILKAGRNIKNVNFINVSSLNIYDVLKNDKLLTTKDIFKKLGTGSFLQQEINPSPSTETKK